MSKNPRMSQRFVNNFLLKRKLSIGVYIKVVALISSFPMSDQRSLNSTPTRKKTDLKVPKNFPPVWNIYHFAIGTNCFNGESIYKQLIKIYQSYFQTHFLLCYFSQTNKLEALLSRKLYGKFQKSMHTQILHNNILQCLEKKYYFKGGAIPLSSGENFFKHDPIGVLLCGESIARIPET
jgi:hypothetical protein